jgi:GNAT superfamily N-acetyltransferase
MMSSAPTSDGLTIRPMRPDEVPLAIDWAAAEGWNPGLRDAACFAVVDPLGFLIAERDAVPVATISCVNYDDHFSFLGFYIVRRDLRGQGYGLRLWQAAMAHAGSRVVGLDGVVAQQDNYWKSGFSYAYANIRYGGRPVVPPQMANRSDVITLADVPLGDIEASDAAVFPAPRRAFLQAWIGARGHVGRALIRDGALKAWSVIRPCRTGYKIGPLVAESRADAEAVVSTLLTEVGDVEVFLDVPAINPDAVALAEGLGLEPVFETARMYTGPAPPLRIERVFGVTTFELG